MAYDLKLFQKLLTLAVRNGVSDIHLRAGEHPYFRIKGSLKPIKSPTISKQDMLEICKIIIPEKKVLATLGTLKEYDGSYQHGKICRVRVNILKFQGRFAIIMRVIAMEVPTLAALKLPKAVKAITNAKRGLVLVTGVTGSGKSSTLAAMLEEINLTRSEHILTIEDPVEFLFSSKKCRITQREIGTDTESFQLALRGALRQDPDVIVIGELRDADTIQIAMKAAETGHLVFATVHTTNAPSTINRIVSMFPPEEQNNIQKRLSECLQATISQRLLPSLDGKGRVCAQEIMVNKVGIQDCISGKEPLSQMYVTIEKARGEMQSFDQHLTKLYKEKKVSYNVAMEAASSPTNFERNLEFGGNDDDENDENDENDEEETGPKVDTNSEESSDGPPSTTSIGLELNLDNASGD